MADIVQNIIDKLHSEKDRSFEQLFDNGDPTGYESFDDAALALCKMIAVWTQDPDIIDAVFQQSKLIWPALWAKNGHDIIQKALLTPKQPNQTPSFIVTVERGKKVEEKVSAPRLAEWVRKNVPYYLAMDDVNGNMMVYKQKTRYR